MAPEALQHAVAHAGLAAIGVGFLAGFLFSFNPVAMASIPVSLAYVTKARERKQAILFGTMFIVGMLVIHVTMGFIAGLGGRWVADLVGREWGLALGPLLIVLGLMWVGWVRLPLPPFALKARRPSAAWSAFVLGAVFSVAICPVCTPALVVLLGATAGLASPWIGAALLLAFAAGRAVPIAIGAMSIGWLENMRGLDAFRRAFETAGGIVLVLSGLYMLNAYFFWVPALAG
ncbi:cytochrome c-type biogenesis protein [Enhydrobacter aerosaccus]|uniref:Cytochrome c-type biogenesis protein n=1 Tax=Enhydrobacter aerosaccus TaxID=225324 RepID=A0A1T4SAE7_9HYPH|nr:cytochrome c biogenesis protein CcdA [Enhydrobacter aerosaccus]SKA24858.1 cytochrome c-type biogenesis protein [Enhydrobacter aerosaccus]